ncbi:hypothetical protein KR222_003363 [Zaprionus bogoriensis]|nr:hypothetical protein KR222_003363 [Zaprionus bogoriensis]
MSESEEMQISYHVTLKMQSEDRGVLLFRIRRQMPLSKLKDAYCSRTGMPKERTFLTFDGERIDDGDTATSLDLEEGDILDVMVQRQSQAGDGASLSA